VAKGRKKSSFLGGMSKPNTSIGSLTIGEELLQNDAIQAAAEAPPPPGSLPVKDPYDGNLLLSLDPGRLAFPVTLGVSLISGMIPSYQVRIGMVLLIVFALVFLMWFYRSPPIDKSGYGSLHPLDVVSPATGVILRIDRLSMADVSADYGPLVSYVGGQIEGAGNGKTGEAVRFVIGLRPTDVHVQAMPMTGVVNRLTYKVGAFEPIFWSGLFGESATKSDRNERMIMEFLSLKEPTTGRSFTFYVVQLAGLLARRITEFDNTDIGTTIDRGSKYGMIKFGSRVDLIVPAVYSIEAQVGDFVNVGETLLGRYNVE
jgi:phosphatidylserine decarboxylase precursor-related protein